MIATDTTIALTLESGDIYLADLDGRNGHIVPNSPKDGSPGYGYATFAFLPGGKSLVSTGTDGMIRLTDVATGKVMRTFGERLHRPRVLAVSPDGKRVAASGLSGVIRVWDLATGTDALPLGGHQLKVERVSVSADGSVVVTAGKDQSIRVWDPVTGTEQKWIAPAPRSSCAA